MAQHFVRKETAGSIFYRQLKWKERPLWYDVYVANPPHTETSTDTSFPIRKLYYKDDIAMARFYKQFRSLGAISISNEESESLCKNSPTFIRRSEKRGLN